MARKLAKRYIPSLDGLRALAVLAVITYHLNIGWSQGGLLGVTVFFVLSGYLITSLLTREWDEHGSIDLPHFWLRRVRRLFPAVFTTIIVVTILCILFNHILLTKVRPDILPSIFFCQNWWYVFRGLSYFEALGDPSPLTHFWSLAIEEQFYVVWPILLIIMFRVTGGQRSGKRIIRRICLVLSVVSVIVMAVLYNPQADPTRVYYGTDTRAFSLLIGAWLSFFWPSQYLTERSTANMSKGVLIAIDVVGVVALVALLFLMGTVDGMSPFMYYGGLLLVSVITAVLIAVLAHPRSMLAKVFALKPLVYIGTRSYAMYLWHYPIILLLKPINPEVGTYPWWFCLLALALTIAASELSFRFIEDPIRHGALGRKFNELRASGFDRRLVTQVSTAGPVLAVAICLAFTGIGCALVPDEYSAPQDAITSTGESAGHAKDMTAEEGSSSGEQPTQEQAAAGSTSTESTKSKKTEEKKSQYVPLLVGDSVPGDAEEEFEELFPKGLNDSYIGRWTWQGTDVVKEYIEQGVVGKVIVFCCFSNHRIQDGELDKLLEVVGDKRQLFLVNSYCPESQTQPNNRDITAFAVEHDNVTVIDWYNVCAQDPTKYTWEDRTHLTPEGAKAYMEHIYKNIKKYL